MKVWSAVTKRALRFTERRRLASVALAAGLGVFLALGAEITIPLAAAIAAVCAALAGIVWAGLRRGKGAFGCLLLIVLICFYQYASFAVIQPGDRVALRGALTGTVCAEPLAQAENGRIVLTLDHAAREDGPIAGRVRVYVYGTTDANAFEYGEQIAIENANVTIPKGRTNPGGFDFAAYLWRRGVTYCASASVDKITVTGSEPSLRRALSRARGELLEGVQALYGENADVMRAILLGDRSQLADETYEDFRNTGIAHIIALSGLHVSCIAALLEFILKGLLVPRRVRAVLTLILLYCYGVMTGGGASVVRAILMHSAWVIARECGYQPDVLTCLGLAFLAQISYQPLMMLDVGFQLSYMSIMGMVCLQNLLGRRRKGAGKLESKLREAGSATLAVQLATLPLVCSQFYSVPLLSLPVNLLIAPLGLATVMTGALSVTLYPVFPPLARLMALPGGTVWTATKWITAEAARLPLAVIPARGWPLALGCVYFVWMLLISPYCGLREKARRWGVLLLPVLFAAALVQPRDIPAGLRVTFLDVNYGDAAVIDIGSDTYVIDCGRENGIVSDYLTAAGATVKGVFITHPDTDHAGGLGEVLRRWDYATVYVPDCWDEMDVGETTEAALKNAKVKYLCAGDSVMLGREARAEVLWPEEGFVPKEDNDGSLILRVEYADVRLLFMGDLTNRYDALAAADCDVLKVAHHGSKYATTAEMLEIASPAYAVISVAGNNYGHPTPEVLERLANAEAEVLRTDERGAIIFDIDPAGEINVYTMLTSEGTL